MIDDFLVNNYTCALNETLSRLGFNDYTGRHWEFEEEPIGKRTKKYRCKIDLHKLLKSKKFEGQVLTSEWYIKKKQSKEDVSKKAYEFIKKEIGIPEKLDLRDEYGKYPTIGCFGLFNMIQQEDQESVEGKNERK
jgi:hypothetical protein